MSPDGPKTKISRVTEIYVAVFPVPVDDNEMTEVILAGYRKDPNRPNMSQVRATVETHPGAVQDLVELCDEIVETQEEIQSYRLLKFDKDGIHILNPDSFRAPSQPVPFTAAHVQWGCC
jgi:hypothetical protein